MPCNLSERQRPETSRVAHGVEFIGGQHHQRIRAFHLIQRIAQRPREVPRLRARHQMHDHFRVAVGLEDGAAMLQLAPPLAGVRQVAVVRHGHLALVAIDHDGLDV